MRPKNIGLFAAERNPFHNDPTKVTCRTARLPDLAPFRPDQRCPREAGVPYSVMTPVACCAPGLWREQRRDHDPGRHTSVLAWAHMAKIEDLVDEIADPTLHERFAGEVKN